MPLNGKSTPVAKPSWLKDNSSPLPSTTAAAQGRPAWARKTSDAKAEGPVVKATMPKLIKKEGENPIKDVTMKLQSREVKVPQKVEKTVPAVPTQSILKKPDVKIKQDLKEETKTLPLKSTSKSPSKTPTSVSSKSSPASSKSPSKTPEYETDSEDESSYETETDSSEETETDSSEDEKPAYKPPPSDPKQKLVIPPLKKVVTKSPEKSEPERSTSPDYTFKKPELKKVITKQKSVEKKDRSVSPEPKFIKPKLRKVPSSLRPLITKEKLPVVDLKRAPPKAEPEARKMSEQFPLKPSILRAESNMKIPLPPPPPPPPPPPGLAPPPDFKKAPISQKHREKLEKLKTRPRRRPDWSEMMKEVEEIRKGKKLNHVECNDRSNPIITCKSMARVQGQYVFETEKKDTALNKLLNEIQGGIKLRPTKTNDRSKPILDGLRKFRRQMTIEEQIMKSESKAMLAADPQSPIPDDDEEDGLDDIDKVRDDLQSTKQMLALELRNKEAQERENKRLMAKIANLEAELERERQRVASGGGTAAYEAPTSNGSDDAVVKSLKKEAEEAQKTSKLLEKKYHDVAERLDSSQKEVEEQKRLIANLEKRLQGGMGVDSRRQSEAAQQKESSPELELVLSEEEEDETEEQKAERAARRLKREVDMLHAKLIKLKDKETNAKSERKSLRDAMKKNQQQLRSEKKNLKKLQKEVEKMAKMMQAVEDECDDDEEAEDKAEAEESDDSEPESEPESEESESEESDSDTESQSEAEDADDDKKKSNLEPRVKRHDGRLASLKKGNYLLEANVERLKDEIKDHKERCEALQADLNSVIDLC